MQTRPLALLLLLSTTAAQATTFVERPFPDSVQEAPVIVRGTVGKSYADWAKGQDGTRRIYTYFELQVTDVLKGDVTGRSLMMREMGGEKGGVALQIAGTAQFERGEDVVVFLGNRNPSDGSPEGSYDVWGMMMAKFNLQKDGDGAEYLVGPGIGPEPEGSQPAGRAGPTAKKWTLEALRKLVRDQGQTPKAAPVPTVSLAPRGVPTPVPPASPSAPALQPSKSEEPAKAGEDGSDAVASLMLKWIGGGGAAVLLFFWLRRRRT